MKNYKKELEDQLKEIDALIGLNNKNLAKLKNLPEYGIKASTVRGCHQYYFVDKGTGKREYAGKEKLRLVKRLTQKEYALTVDKKLIEYRNRLYRFVSHYDIREIEDIYEQLPEARKDLVVPITEPDDAYIQRWLEENPGEKNPYPSEGKYYTSQGVYVRSKSEKIIADLLDKYKVPYRYEPELVLGNSNIVYPDFVILNVKERKTIYWEHLGMLGDVDYARKNFEKIAIYEENGYNVGDNLLISMESEQKPFDAKGIENKIKKYCI